MWEDDKNSYAASVGWLCEDCLERGEITPGEIVHHKIPLTPENINNPDIALSWDNLRLLCRRCHGARHRKNKQRYEINSDGNIFIPD